MSITRWSPAREVLTMRDMMNKLFDDVYSYSSEQSRTARLPIDVYSTDNEIIVVASLPGVKPDEVDITIEGDTVTMSGEIKSALENVNYLISERFTGHFTRSLQLNVPVDVENVEASFENGVLTLSLPKAEEVRPKVIKVKTK